MKKLVSLLLAGAIGTAGLIGLTACGDDNAADIDALIKEGQGMTTEQLLEKAKTETGDFVAYGNTSRITKAVDNFKAKYTELGLNDKSVGTKKNDSQIYTLLGNEYKMTGSTTRASMVLIQDSAQLDQYTSLTKMLVNYIPNGMEDKVDEANRVPLAHQFINKLFMYNTAGETNLKFTNVWELTQEKYRDKIFFKSPKTEQVNMNFLIMLTSDEWAGKLETAYKAFNNNQAAEDVGAGKTYKNYGYKWVHDFYLNCNLSIDSDTKIAGQLSSSDNAGKMGLFVLSKLRDDSVQQDNLQVSAWDKKDDNSLQKIEPFAGFMYSIYAQLAANAPRPYTAMLFVNYLMTEEGFKPWASMGGYSANTTVPVTQGDSELSFWQSNLVVENGAYINSVKVDVEDWISKIR